MNIPKKTYILTDIQAAALRNKLIIQNVDEDAVHLLKVLQPTMPGRYLLTDEEVDRIIEKLEMLRGDALAKSLQQIIFDQQQYNPADEAHHEILKNNI